MKIKEVIKNLLEKEMDDELYAIIRDGDGNMRFVVIDGLASKHNQFKGGHATLETEPA